MATLIPATKSVFLLLGVVLMAGLLFAACSHRGRCGSHHDWAENPGKIEAKATKKVDKALDELDATEDQRTRIHALKASLIEDLMAMAGGKQELKDEIRGAWASDSFDPQELHGLVDEKVRSIGEIGHKAADDIAELHGILTPEQREQVARTFDKHCKRR